MTEAKKTILYLPETIDPDNVFQLFGNNRKHSEKALWLLSKIYIGGLFRYDLKNVFIQIHSDDLKYVMGKRRVILKETTYRKEEKEGEMIGEKKEQTKQPKQTPPATYSYSMRNLHRAEIIEIDDSYSAGRFPKSFRFKKRNEGDYFKRQRRYEVKDRTLAARILKLREKSKLEFQSRILKGTKQLTPIQKLVYHRIYQSVIGLTYEDQGEVGLSESEKNYHQMILDGWDLWAVDPQGRVYVYPTVIPKKLRSRLRWNGKPLWSIDISASQPLLHALLYDDTDLKEREEYLQLVSSGELYNNLNERLSKPFDLDDEDQRSQFKQALFPSIFYGHPETKDKGELWNLFNAEFPTLSKKITKAKGTGGDYRELPKTMQTIEAEIMIQEVIGNLDILPLIPIHDCVLTTEEHVETVEAQIRKVFKNDLNLEVRVKRNKLA